MDYRLKKGFFGSTIVLYACTACGAALESPIGDAGTNQTCPTCGFSFVSPGLPELNAQQKAAHENEERLRQEEEQNKKQELAIKAEKVAVRVKVTPPPAPRPPPRMVWYGAMYCHRCGYQWRARRNTPPARCAGCSAREIEAVREPERTVGCIAMILGYAVIGSLVTATTWRLIG